MGLRHRIEHLRREHTEVLDLADRIEQFLEQVSKNDFAERLKGLTGLRSLEHGFSGVMEHCHAEGRIVESIYHHSLQSKERDRIQAEHQQILRAVSDFREELRFATADRTMAIIVPGMDVVNRLRAHIAYEREMLGRIIGREGTTAGRRAHRKQRKRTAARKPHTKTTSFLPYTLEPHPEL